MHINIKIDPTKLNNPDADLRYLIPEFAAAISEGKIKDDGYDYDELGRMIVSLISSNQRKESVVKQLEQVFQQLALEREALNVELVSRHPGKQNSKNNKTRDLKKNFKGHLKVIRKYVALADQMSLGSFPDDEYAYLEFRVYKLLLSNAQVDQVAEALSLTGKITPNAKKIAKEIMHWWET